MSGPRVELTYTRPKVDGVAPSPVTTAAGSVYVPPPFIPDAASESYPGVDDLTTIEAMSSVGVVNLAGLDLPVGARAQLVLDGVGTAGTLPFEDIYLLQRTTLDGVAGYTPVYVGRHTATVGTVAHGDRDTLKHPTSSALTLTGALGTYLLETAEAAVSGSASTPSFAIIPGVAAFDRLLRCFSKGTATSCDGRHSITGR